jgi:hypothetical protein
VAPSNFGRIQSAPWISVAIALLGSIALPLPATHQDAEPPYAPVVRAEYSQPKCQALEVAVDEQANKFLLSRIEGHLDGGHPPESSNSGRLADSLFEYSSACFEEASNKKTMPIPGVALTH